VDCKAGDFAHTRKNKRSYRFVIGNSENFSYFYYKRGGLAVVYLDKDSVKDEMDWMVREDTSFYVKIKPTKRLLLYAKKQLKKIHRHGQIDNLTFVELSDKLRQHEQRTRIS
jgi:hypothetical protein